MATAKRRKKHHRTAGPTMAEAADPLELYEESVQSVEDEVAFLEQTYSELRARKPVSFREDFCGTAKAACEWVRVNRRHRAVGVDIDAAVLEWGRSRHLAALRPGARKRVKLVQSDVREVRAASTDIVAAFNFSYWVFKTRTDLRGYFASVRQALEPDGVLFLDAFGGSEAMEEGKEKTKHNGFTYIWDQASYDPVSGDFLCYIHFRFPDGTRLKKAFTYDWRLWTLPELRELLAEAGFARSTVYWQGTDEDGEANGEFSPVERGEADPAWIVYLVAEK